jgi:outer membrane protein assembly factor BamB
MKHFNSKSSLLTFALLSLCLSGCKHEKVAPFSIYTPKQGKLNLIWKTTIDENKQSVESINPILNSNGDVIMSNFPLQQGKEPIMLFDGNTGKLKWKWADYLRDEDGFWENCHSLYNDILVLCSHNATYALNILTGQTVWKHFFPTKYGSPFIFKDEKGYVYHSFHGDPGDYTNYIYRTKFDQLNWELICTIEDSVNNRFERRYIDNMTFSYNNKGEQLIIYELWKANTIDDPNTVLACYNMDSKKYEWVKNYTDKFNEWGSPQMLSDNQNVYAYIYYGTDYHLVAIKIADGTIAWDHIVPNYGVGLFQHNGNIISTCAISSPVVCFNGKTGKEQWRQSFSPTELSAMNFEFGSDCVCGNYLFSTQCNNILVLDLITGSVVYNEQTSFEDGCFEHGVAINQQKGVFYVGDRTYVNCIKLPEAVKF